MLVPTFVDKTSKVIRPFDDIFLFKCSCGAFQADLSISQAAVQKQGEIRRN